ncbi:MAG TPA: ABC transporter substrate-binding protein, partial [Polyangiaceae bacterium]|nr:ABC transporter substrate-binding protein [Polyangiaceae bacterium]
MRFSLRPLLVTITLALTLATTAPALAQTPDEFVKVGHAQLESLLKQPVSAQRDAQISATFDQLVDYSELIKRCFKEHWGELDAAKQTEVSELLRQIVRKNYKKNLNRTLNYNVTYTGVRGAGNEVTVRTQAQSKVNSRDPVVQIDYVVDGPLSSYNTNTVGGAASAGAQAFARTLTGFGYHGPDGQVVADRDFGTVSVVGGSPLVLDYQIA